jgi:hypothetical protein
MNAELKEVLDKIDGIRFRASTNDLPMLLQNITSMKAHIKALTEFIIESLAELKNEEAEKLQDDYEKLLASFLADDFSQFLSDSDRMT